MLKRDEITKQAIWNFALLTLGLLLTFVVVAVYQSVNTFLCADITTLSSIGSVIPFLSYHPNADVIDLITGNDLTRFLLLNSVVGIVLIAKITHMASVSSKNREEYLKRTIWEILVFIITLSILAPLYMLLKYSISDQTTITTFGRPIPLWPNHPTLAVFKYLFGDREFWGVVWNSTIIALATVVLTMMFSVPAGYVLARYNFPMKRFFLLLLISVRLFPDISSVIPITTFFVTNETVYAINSVIDSIAEFIGIYTKPSGYIAIILSHTLLSLPYVIFMATTAFEFIPKDIEEQASVMGAKRFTIFTKILLPIVFPSLIAGAIYTFLLSWDEFIFAHFLLDTGSGQLQTLTLYLNQNLSFSPPQNILAAISVCLSVPVMIFTFIVQRYMVTGMVSGSVK